MLIGIEFQTTILQTQNLDNNGGFLKFRFCVSVSKNPNLIYECSYNPKFLLLTKLNIVGMSIRDSMRF